MVARRARLTIAALLLLGGLVTAVLGFPATLGALDTPGYVVFQVVLELAGLAWLVPGAVLLLHDDRHPVGWCLLWVGVVNLLQYNDLLFVPYDSPWVALAMDEWLSESFFAALVTIVAVFPDGLASRPPRARRTWRVVLSCVWLAAAATAFTRTLGSGEDSPFRSWDNPLPGAVLPPAVLGVAFPLLFLALVAAVVGLLRRARRQTSLERRRYRMVQSAMGLTLAGVVAGFGLSALSPWMSSTGVAWVPAVASFVLLPTAFLAAILRYGLYDIDRLVSRTVTWSAVALVVGVAYVVPVVVFSTAFGRGNDLVVAAATLVAAAVARPAHRRLQAAVDRRFDRARYDAEREAAAFATRMRTGVQLTPVVDDLEAVVQRTLAPGTLGVWLPPGHASP